MKANKNLKDSVFSAYFSEDTARLVELFNALEGTDYPPDTPVEINTLTDVLWMDRINDLSFVLNGQLLVLLEHQSTVNHNMALRALLYCARLYEKLLPRDAIYRTGRVRVPNPRLDCAVQRLCALPGALYRILKPFFLGAGRKSHGKCAGRRV